MDVDMAAVWPLRIPEGPDTHDQPRPPGAQYAVADGYPDTWDSSPVPQGLVVHREREGVRRQGSSPGDFGVQGRRVLCVCRWVAVGWDRAPGRMPDQNLQTRL